MILAGGRGQRLGGVDKGWIELAGRPLIAHVLERFAPQVGEIIISANRNLERYAALGHAVVSDATSEFAGPLAGLLAAWPHARFDLLCTVPCDGPALPANLVGRLQQALEQSTADIAVAGTAERAHPVFALYRVGLRASLVDYFAAGGRSIRRWQGTQRRVEASFGDAADGFCNINTPDDLHQVRLN